MDQWNEAEHPRGGTGKFAAKDQQPQAAAFPPDATPAEPPSRERRTFRGSDDIEDMQPGDIFLKVDDTMAGRYRSVIVGRVEFTDTSHVGRIWVIYDAQGRFVASGSAHPRPPH